MSYDKKIYSSAVIAMMGVALMTTSSFAAILTFTDQATWEAALAGAASLEDFEGVTADDDFTNGSTTVGSLGLAHTEELTFTNNGLVDVLPHISSSLGANFSGDAHVSMRFLGNNPADSVTVTLPAGQSAFAFEYRNYDNGSDGAEVSFAGDNGGVATTIFPIDDSTPREAFFGVVDDAGGAITSFAFTGVAGSGSSTFMSFDDVRWGVAVPEPASIALLGIAGIAVLGMRRKEG